ncbi:MAG: hypothetical protein IJX74_05190 [Clostridia bacterium]|nr:hypothetical protein [Clostridia bacterium]
MKKILVLFTALCLLLASSCNFKGDIDTTAATDTTGAESATSEETTTESETTTTEETTIKSPNTSVEETTTESESTTAEETTTELESTTVEETTTEPETTTTEDDDWDHLRNSEVTVTSGENSVNPLQFFSATTICEGDMITEGCGGGIYGAFSDPKFNKSRFPVLNLEGEISAVAPANTTLGKTIEVYDMSYTLLDTVESLTALSELAEGEYIIVLLETIKNISSETDYSIYYNDIAFKLIVA